MRHPGSPQTSESAYPLTPQAEEASNAPADRLEMFRSHRKLLFSIAYRMLGSAADAEDILQETYIRLQQSTEEEIHSPRAYLVTIASRLCINHLQSARVKRERYFGQWLPEPVVTGQVFEASLISEMDDTLSTAFLMLLERLTPVERAVFLLHEVFDYEYSDIARILEQNEVNCRQILHRARQHVKDGRPRFDPSPQQHEELLQQFLEASSRGDMDGLLDLFAKAIVLYADGGGKAAAVPNPIYGAANVAKFLTGARHKLLPQDLVRRVAHINGRLGVVVYYRGHPHGVMTMDVADGHIHNIYIVSNPDKIAHFPMFPSAPC